MHPSPLPLESITKYIVFNSEYSVVICHQCKCALAPGEGIKRHFQNLHQTISLQTRKEIIAYCETLTLLPSADVITPTYYSRKKFSGFFLNLSCDWLTNFTTKKTTVDFSVYYIINFHLMKKKRGDLEEYYCQCYILTTTSSRDRAARSFTQSLPIDP